jgi:transcriptional regulator with GAF, ATPase, and Fis domain
MRRMRGTDTLDYQHTEAENADALPGVVLCYVGRAPAFRAIPLDRPVRLGRAPEGGVAVDDGHMSREHAEIALTPQGFAVRDLGSRNGTFVDGVALGQSVRTSASAPVVRMGQTLAFVCANVLPFLAARPLVDDGKVLGPGLRAALAAVERVASSGENILITGESGSGKELAARTFHASGPHAAGPFIAVNCAAIPEGVAERLLFGAKKGAYSGAVADVQGYVQAAERGVLFLDEFGELDLDVQAKLLRVVETNEVLPLGASQVRRVDVRFCFATHRDLRTAIADGRFRADLYYRIGQAGVDLPPLRARREEIPWLVAQEVERAPAPINVSAEFVELCLLRVWPGNVRELIGEVRRAVRRATQEGARTLRAEHLDAKAGMPVAASPPPSAAPPPPSEKPPEKPRDPVTRDQLHAALSETPNASAAAKRLGIHRSHLYRLMKQFGVDGKE